MVKIFFDDFMSLPILDYGHLKAPIRLLRLLDFFTSSLKPRHSAKELFAYSTNKENFNTTFSQIQPTISGVFGRVEWEEEQQSNNMRGDPMM